MTTPARTAAVDAALWVASAVCVGLTTWLSLIAVPPGTSSFAWIDKVQHFVAYLVTASVLYLAAVWRPGRGDGIASRRSGVTIVALLAAAVAVEIVQRSVGRDADLLDWLAGGTGIVIAFGAISYVRRRSASTPPP